MLVQRIAADGNDTDATTLHTAEYDALGRRIEKVVSNCGDLDGTYRYGYNGQQVIEIRDGSSNVLTQAYYGTQYIDEIVALKLEHGYAVVSQDANYNVTTLTDLAGRVLERVFTTEYGQPILESDSYFGDYDADGDVDATDDGFLGSGQTCWGANPSGACRVFDFNSDGTLDASDETVMTALVAAPTTNRIHHARRTSPAGNLFLHQGLLYDAEIGAYQNRARAYDPFGERFLQRDLVLRSEYALTKQLSIQMRIWLSLYHDTPTVDYVVNSPIDYLDGANTYSNQRRNPYFWFDPLGLSCGPGDWPDWVIPDGPGKIWEGCCQDHDDCYGACFGPPKSTCDGNMCKCMRSQCWTTYWVNQKMLLNCLIVAAGYCEAISSSDKSVQRFAEGRASCNQCAGYGKTGCGRACNTYKDTGIPCDGDFGCPDDGAGHLPPGTNW